MSIKMSRMPSLVPKSGELFEEMEAVCRTVELMGDMIQCFDMRHGTETENLLFRDLTCRTDENGTFEPGYGAALGIMDKVQGDISNLLKRNKQNEELRKMGSRPGLNQEDSATLEFMCSYRKNLLSPENIHEFSELMREAQVGSKGIKDVLNYNVKLLHEEACYKGYITQEVSFTLTKRMNFNSLILKAVSELNSNIEAHNESVDFENYARRDIEPKKVPPAVPSIIYTPYKDPEGYRHHRDKIYLEPSLINWLKTHHAHNLKSATTIRMMCIMDRIEPSDKHYEGVRACHFKIYDQENGFQVPPAHLYILSLLIYGIENRGFGSLSRNMPDFTDGNSLVFAPKEWGSNRYSLAIVPTSEKHRAREWLVLNSDMPYPN